MTTGLERIGAVSAEYRHVSKVARPGPILSLGEALLKWYDVAPEDASVPHDVREEAYEALCLGSRSGQLDLSGDLGFVILHRCGESFYFLLLSTWRNENELWETVWAKDGDAARFEPWPVGGPHRPTFCVWELGAVCHERRAWSRYLRSPRDAAARQEYLLDALRGDV